MFYKVITTGHVIEIYQYEYMSENKPKGKQLNPNEEKIKLNGNYEYTNKRRRENIRRLATQNFNNKDLFVTLTFEENITDVAYAYKEFQKFIMRLKRIDQFSKKYKDHNNKTRYERIKDLKYLAVTEFQKRGAIHFHILINIDYPIEWELEPIYYRAYNLKEFYIEHVHPYENKLKEIWKHGNCDIQKIKHVDNIGAYLIKYMHKDMADLRLKGKKAYLYSRKTLDKPVTYKSWVSDDIENFVKELKESKYIPVSNYTYESEYQGKIIYRQYNLRREGAMLG